MVDPEAPVRLPLWQTFVNTPGVWPSQTSWSPAPAVPLLGSSGLGVPAGFQLVPKPTSLRLGPILVRLNWPNTVVPAVSRKVQMTSLRVLLLMFILGWGCSWLRVLLIYWALTMDRLGC